MIITVKRCLQTIEEEEESANALSVYLNEYSQFQLEMLHVHVFARLA